MMVMIIDYKTTDKIITNKGSEKRQQTLEVKISKKQFLGELKKQVKEIA